MNNEGTLTPAYGRDYKSKKACLEDFRAGKDFYYNSPYQSAYCSIRYFKEGSVVKFRYDNRRKACFYTIAAIDKVDADEVG